MSDMRWAVMGTGRIAAGVLPLLAEAPQCSVTVIASRDRARAEALARDSGVITGDPARAACIYDELAQRDDVDAVYLTLLNQLHLGWTLRLLEAGKHVLCEKPLVPTRAEAQRIADAARRAGRLCAEGLMYMHHPQTARLIELARLGDASPIGRLIRIRSHRNVNNNDAYILRTRRSHAMQGGAVMDIGCYPISAARLIAGGEPRLDTIRAAAELAPPAPGESLRVDDTCSFSWTFENGVEFEGECSFSKGARTGIEIFVELIGERGTAFTEYPFSPDPTRQVLIVNGREEVFENGGDKFTNQFTDFARAARGEIPPLPTTDWSVGQAATIEAIHRTIGLRLPPSDPIGSA